MRKSWMIYGNTAAMEYVINLFFWIYQTKNKENNVFCARRGTMEGTLLITAAFVLCRYAQQFFDTVQVRQLLVLAFNDFINVLTWKGRRDVVMTGYYKVVDIAEEL